MMRASSGSRSQMNVTTQSAQASVDLITQSSQLMWRESLMPAA